MRPEPKGAAIASAISRVSKRDVMHGNFARGTPISSIFNILRLKTGIVERACDAEISFLPAIAFEESGHSAKVN
jgi:hypothetical protein